MAPGGASCLPAATAHHPLPDHPTLRAFTNKPENTVYSGPLAQNPQRVTLKTIADKYTRGERISMVTAYDYPSAVHVCALSTTVFVVSTNAHRLTALA